MSKKQKTILITCVCIAVTLVIILVLVLLIIPGILKHVFALSFADMIEQYSYENEVDPYLTAAVIFCESKYDPDAVSKAGARGLMQIMPTTGQEIAETLGVPYGDDTLFDPETSIRFGTYYLRYLLNRFDNRIPVAVAAYNAGPGKASQWLNEYGLNEEGAIRYIPYGETDRYVTKVLKVKKIYEILYRNVFSAPDKTQETIYVADNYSACGPRS